MLTLPMHFVDYDTTKGICLFCSSKVFLNYTQQSSFGNQQRQKLLFVEWFLVVKIMPIYAKILLSTKMSRLLQNVILKNSRWTKSEFSKLLFK